MKPCVAVLATMDTKGPHARLLREELEALGLRGLLVDAGLGPPSGVQPDIDRHAVAAAAGKELEAARRQRRDRFIAHMGLGAQRLVSDLFQRGEIQGLVALGGNQGSAVAALAFAALPAGFPKALVSTVASGNIRPLVRASDVWVAFSVGDFVDEPNPVSRAVIRNTAAAVCGLVRFGSPVPQPAAAPVVALTALGNTDGAVRRCRRHLAGHGYEVVTFHASGAGGSAMEELIEGGYFHAVLDLTPHELLGEVLGDDIYAPVRPGRLLAAARRGLPLVVAPGGLDYFCFGAPDTVPSRYHGRPTHYHNPYNTNVRATPAELARVGEVLAERLNRARGPVAFVVPAEGWTENGRPGGPLHDPEADAALVSAFLARAGEHIRVVRVPGNLNDPPAADAAASLLVELAAEAGVGAGPPPTAGRQRWKGGRGCRRA